MRPNEYKAACQAPDVFSRAALEATIEALGGAEPALSSRLTDALSAEPIVKPPQHRGGPETDFFRVSLTAEEVHELISHLVGLEAEAVAEDGSTTPEASYMASLVDYWASLWRDASSSLEPTSTIPCT